MRGLLCMQKVSSSFILKVLPRACLICLVCISLIAFTSYTAPKAQAEAITLTLTSAFIMLVIAVMGTLGVTLTSSSNNDAIEYISDAFGQFLHDVKGTSSSIDEFLSSIGLGAIGLLGAPIHGAISIGKLAYDLIAEFCTWFFSDKEVVSGGEPIGEIGSINHGLYRGSVSSTGIYVISGDFPLSTSVSSDGKTISMSGPANSDWVIRLNPGSYTYSVSTSAPAYSLAYILLAYPYPNSSLNSASGSTRVVTKQRSGTIGVANNRSLAFGLQGATSGYSATITISASSGVLQQPNGFVLTPSANVITPPSIAVGQSYNVPAEGVTDTSDIEVAIPSAIAPLTTTGGLSNTGTVAGTAVQSEFEWLYEDTQSIRNNTNPHFDFIPSALGFDFSIWHYVTEMMSSVHSAISLFGTFIQNMPPAILVFPFGVFALCITVALFRRFLS